MYALETHNLTKKYSNAIVVNDVNLNVKKGDVFGFLGRNGAGKSTFINMVTGIINPSSGSFKIFGEEEIEKDAYFKRIGVLPDYSTFYDDLNPYEHLKYFSNIFGIKTSKNDIIELLVRVGLGDAISTKAKKFSFGMKKKLGIAQALVNNPELVFLDEPTSGVDADAVLNIHTLIRQLSHEGKTIFMTSHNLDEVEKMCDEIAIMSKGVIKCKGSMDHLRKEFQPKISVKIKHAPIPAQSLPSVKHIFEKVGTEIEWSNGLTSLVVASETDIPILNRALGEIKIDVYRVEVNEPSLEDIFLGVGNEKNSA